MKTRTHSSTTFTIPGTEIEVELPFEPSSMDYREPLVRITEDQIILGYLSHDSDCENPLEYDYMGHIYEGRRRGDTLRDYEKALGLGDFSGEPHNPYAVMLDVYEHGSVSYSLSGAGMQCDFDTARGGAVWVPSDALLEELKTHQNPTARARELAKQAAEAYTHWRNGSCYGVVVVTYDKEGEELNHDAVWGFVGDDYAWSSLESDYFPKEVA